MRDKYNEQLQELNEELIQMGSLCEECISRVMLALSGDKENNEEKLHNILTNVYHTDAEIDEMEKTIETLCLKLLLKQQPVASDLRLVSSALKMISDMERIGDQCADIADIAKYLEHENAGEILHAVPLQEMAAAVTRMVTEAVDSFVGRDLEKAREVIASDDTVDALFEKTRADIAGLAAKYPEKGMVLLDVLMVAKYFERIGDHATNIAEWVEFAMTGEHEKKLKYEESK